MPPTSILQRARPNLGGTITRGGVTTSYAPSVPRTQLNPMYDESQDPQAPMAAPRPMAPRPVVARAPAPMAPAMPDMSGLTPGSFGEQNAMNNAGYYQAGSFGAANAEANGTGYRAPQQTERANPLSGDNNVPMESASTPVTRAPFVQRGAGVPAGQDVAPPSNIGGAMQGTFDNLRAAQAAPGRQANIGGTGQFARRFSNPQSASAFDGYVRRLFQA